MVTDYRPRIIPKRKLEDKDLFISYVQQVLNVSDATTTNKGIASFDAESFAVTAGAVSLILDDTAVNGELNEPITSNWAYDHKFDVAAHSNISDAIYGAAWDNTGTIAPSKNAVYDKIELMQGVIDALNSVLFAVGTYTGNGGADRQIAVGFTAKLAIIFNVTDNIITIAWSTASCMGWDETAVNNGLGSTVTRLHATDGFIADVSGVVGTDTNISGKTFHYWVIGV